MVIEWWRVWWHDSRGHGGLGEGLAPERWGIEPSLQGQQRAGCINTW